LPDEQRQVAEHAGGGSDQGTGPEIREHPITGAHELGI
jgi:hypothetical protein